MIDIASLSPGDIVRNIGSGREYVVSGVPQPYLPTVGPMYWRVSLLNGPECSNPQEWEVARYREPLIGEAIGGEYAIEVSIGDRTVRYSAPSAEGVAELMRVDSDHVMGVR